ncbi:MAG: UvrD-helicase domain-containing protein [Candidatus Cybelea sp.]
MKAEESLASAAPFVLIEAPAGCGKTHVACDYARGLAPHLGERRRVLILAHTNAAVEEFTSRTQDIKSCVRISTFDSLSLGIVRPYAQALGLSHPIRVGDGQNRVSPGELSVKARELLDRCPHIATMLVHLHPIVVLDEHQDASTDQHAIAMILRGAGARIRAFGDPMQRIFGDEDEGLEWEQIKAQADLVGELSQPFRWSNNPQLGAWILDARDRLASGRHIDMSTAPASVACRVVRGGDIAFGAGQPPDYAYAIRQMPAGVSALLTARTAHMVTLRRASSNAAHLYEGSQLEHVYTAFDAFAEKLGNPQAMSFVLLDLIHLTCTGLTRAYRTRIEQSLNPDQIDPGRQHLVRPVLDILAAFYAEPTFHSVGKVCRLLLEKTPGFLHIEKPAAFRILSAIAGTSADAYDEFQDIVQSYKAVSRRPDFAVSTVHRAKGFQFEHVLVSNVSSSHFPDDDRGRRLLYVAISRCMRSLTILLPQQGASPLLV